MTRYTIGISCIGSGVGQSVIGSLRLSDLPLTTVGLGTNPFAYGAYECDRYDHTPTIYADTYIPELIQTCRKHRIDLLIPGMDDEVFILARHEKELRAAGVHAIFSGEQMVALCRDKEVMRRELANVADLFVKSYDRAGFLAALAAGEVRYPCIAKPRGGFASRGVVILRSEADIDRITDDHIVQELAVPAADDPHRASYMAQIAKGVNPQIAEVSIQVVVSPDGKVMGRMASYNKLNNGVPIEIVPYDRSYVWDILDRLTPLFIARGLRGPLNIQGRLTDTGFKIFEMNPRFTGITGLRALMGFNEVEACVKEWLGIDTGRNQLVFNYSRFGIRQTADKSLPIERNDRVADLSRRVNERPAATKKRLLVTGAGGYVGRNLLAALTASDAFTVWAFDLDKEHLRTVVGDHAVACCDRDDLTAGRLPLGQVDILLHLGFARPHRGDAAIAESLAFTFDLFTRAALHQVPAIVNISSQSVYGRNPATPWREDTPPAPAIPYAQAKFAVENLLRSLGRQYPHLRHTSLRLAALSGGAAGLTVDADFLAKFVRQALNGDPIVIAGGGQEMERFDLRDAVTALIALLRIDPMRWKPCYNIGSGEVRTIADIARMVAAEAKRHNGGKEVEVRVTPPEVAMKFGMDCTLFRAETGWSPRYCLKDTIDSLLEHLRS